MKKMEQQVPKIYRAITAVQDDLSKTGIAKDRKNQKQGYNFRGIDDVYGALSPLLAKHGLCILPNVLEREVVERKTIAGGTLFYVTVRVRFDFVCAEDGSKHEVVTYGEAMDSADKATNKAMSASYKYAAIQAFCIPTEGDNDADAQTHEVATSFKAKPTDGALDSLSPAAQVKVAGLAAAITAKFKAENEWGAFEAYETRNMENDETIALWSLLDSKVRSSIKRMKAEEDKSIVTQEA